MKEDCMDFFAIVREAFGSRARSEADADNEQLMSEFVRLLQTNGYDSNKPRESSSKHPRHGWCPDDVQ
jgi:hypothetical protein